MRSRRAHESDADRSRGRPDHTSRDRAGGALCNRSVCSLADRAKQLLASLRTTAGRTYVTALDDYFFEAHGLGANIESTLRRTDIVEIQGPPACGKTHLLTFFIMTAVLPGSWDVKLLPPIGSSAPPQTETVAVGGKAKAVAFFDCDGRFDATRLEKVLRSHLVRRLEATTAGLPGLFGYEPSVNALDATVRACLKRVHVFSPTSSLSLAATLHRLPAYHRKECLDDEIIYLMIDSMSAFFFQDCYRAGTAAGRRPLPTAHVLTALTAARRRLGCVTFLTNWILAAPASSSTSSNAPPKQHLPTPYPAPFLPSAPPPRLPDPKDPFAERGLQLTHHLTLFPAPVAPFPAQTSLASAKSRQPERSRVLEESMAVGVTRSAALQEKDGLTQLKWLEMGQFDFGIRDWGLETS